MRASRWGLVVCVALCAAGPAWGGQGAQGGPLQVPPKLRDAPANTWVRITEIGTEGRSSPALVWVPDERAFVCLGGKMGMLPKDQSPYSELTLNFAESRWENRFPKGKLGPWGELVGPAKAPGFPGSYYAVRMKDSDGNVRPYLGSGYDRGMYLYSNFAWDPDRGRVVVAWHLGGVMAEYDPAERTWRVVDSAAGVPEGFSDDFLWGAMCYDPVNKEVLGGQGRWASSTQTGQWRRLEFRGKVVDPLRASAVKLHARAKDLVGACRSRYYLSETPAEAEARLDEAAAGVEKDAGVLADELAAASGGAAGHERDQIAWALDELASARAVLRDAAEVLKGKVTAPGIHKIQDARDLLERCCLWLAVQPPPRALSPMVYDAASRKIVLFGGDRLDRRLADTWVYDCTTRTWRQQRPKLSPPPRAGHGLTWLPKARKVLLVDGYGIGPAGQCWVYDTAANEWALLAEGDAKRPVLTDYPHYTWLPGPLAGRDDDLVVMIRRGEEFRDRPTADGTWAARIDAAKIDSAGTLRLGVAPLTMTQPAGTHDPRWYEATGPPPDAQAAAGANADPDPDPNAKKALDAVPLNTWVPISPPNRPQQNRAWGTAVLDTARDQIIQWDGGHAAYSGNDVLHYSIRANRCSTGSFYPEFALNWNASMLFPPMPTTFSGRPFSQHGYHAYGFDPVSTKVICFSRSAGRFFAYDPLGRDWQGAFGRRFGGQVDRDSINMLYDTTCISTPGGLVAWTPRDGLLRLDAATMAWKAMPLKGKLPATSVDNQGMALDTKRDRLLLFTKDAKGGVATYDMKTGEVGVLAPAGTGKVSYRPRETAYIDHADAVIVGALPKFPDGKERWLVYDCARNTWVGLDLPGKSVPPGFGLGLMYDPKRKLIWAADSYLNLSVLRLDLKTADAKDLQDEGK